MPHDLTHASFFSGVGGLDMGLERAGWRTVSFSEIDAYASAVLAERWPGVPNLGCIRTLSGHYGPHDHIPGDGGLVCVPLGSRDRHARPERSDRGPDAGEDAAGAALWTGGFPCQDLSVAGKRRGLAGERSGLAFAFLDLVERHRPPAILLENVPGLLSSNAGRDLGALLGRLGELGYWWAYRILDAQFFGVPQRRRRVFICALHAGAGFGADSAAAVLSVGARCGGHSAAGDEARTGAARRPAPGIDIARAITGTSGKRHDDDTDTLISPAAYADRVRASDGLAGRLDDLAPTLTAPDTRHRIEGGKRQDGSRRDRIPVTLAPTLRVGPQRPQDGGPGDTVPITLDPATQRNAAGLESASDSLLPLGLDSHRYRCCGNGVVSNVSEWIGVPLARAVEERAA